MSHTSGFSRCSQNPKSNGNTAQWTRTVSYECPASIVMVWAGHTDTEKSLYPSWSSPCQPTFDFVLPHEQWELQGHHDSPSFVILFVNFSPNRHIYDVSTQPLLPQTIPMEYNYTAQCKHISQIKTGWFGPLCKWAVNSVVEYSMFPSSIKIVQKLHCCTCVHVAYPGFEKGNAEGIMQSTCEKISPHPLINNQDTHRVLKGQQVKFDFHCGARPRRLMEWHAPFWMPFR